MMNPNTLPLPSQQIIMTIDNDNKQALVREGPRAEFNFH